MIRKLVRASAGVLVWYALVACSANVPAVHTARRLHIALRALAFQPAALVVAPGDTITWTNYDVVPHTVTSDAGEWESGSIEGAKSWSHVVTLADSAGYFCRFHPEMRARLSLR